MAMGRKIPTSRSERYLGSLAGHFSSNGEAELNESDVWAMVDDVDIADNHCRWTPRAAVQSNYAGGGRQGHGSVGGLSLEFNGSRGGNSPSRRIVHQFRSVEAPRRSNAATSAPVNVPDWSKIYRVDSVESLHEPDDDFLNDSEMEPPHEYLARAYATSRANSVFVGVGRTLKGRDMSRVRDAVWSQTGFDG